MPRKNLNVNSGIKNQGRVRKRGISPSSSSPLIRSYRLKRAILVGKIGGSSTPVPIWKMTSKSPSLLNEKSVAFKNLDRDQELSVSARKLAATLWGINDVVAPKLQDNVGGKMSEEERRRKDRILKESQLKSMEAYLVDPSSVIVPQDMDKQDLNFHQRRNSVGSQKNLSLSFNDRKSGSFKDSALVEANANKRRPHDCSTHGSRVNSRLKEVVAALTTSKELLKVLSHINYVEDHPTTNLALLAALKDELDRACIQVNKVICDHNLNERLIDQLLAQFELEKANWKIRAKERFQSAIRSMAGEHAIEKKLKRQTERLNKKLGVELAETREKLSLVTKELESERRANGILEQVCDELATEMGKDRAKVEELKRESAKIRAEVEKEREMLQIADILREERVQMKLSEAKYQFEEKNAVVEKLKSELEAYLSTKVDEEQVGGSPNYERIKELENYLRETLPVPCQYQDQGKDAGEVRYKDEEEEEEDSAGSDLHSIELNVEDKNKSYIWSDVQDGSDEEAIISELIGKGRKSISSKGPGQRISFERQTSYGIEWEFSPNRQGTIDLLDEKESLEIFSKAWNKGSEDELERYNIIKDLRDHIVSASKTAVPGEVSKYDWKEEPS